MKYNERSSQIGADASSFNFMLDRYKPANKKGKRKFL